MIVNVFQLSTHRFNTYVHTYVHIYIHTNTYINVHKQNVHNTHTHARTHTHTHTHTKYFEFKYCLVQNTRERNAYRPTVLKFY